MHTEQSTTTFPDSANPYPWPSSPDEAGPWLIFGDDADAPDEDDPARTDHPVPGVSRRGVDEDRPDEDDPARTDHPVPGATN